MKNNKSFIDISDIINDEELYLQSLNDEISQNKNLVSFNMKNFPSNSNKSFIDISDIINDEELYLQSLNDEISQNKNLVSFNMKNFPSNSNKSIYDDFYTSEFKNYNTLQKLSKGLNYIKYTLKIVKAKLFKFKSLKDLLNFKKKIIININNILKKLILLNSKEFYIEILFKYIHMNYIDKFFINKILLLDIKLTSPPHSS